MEMQRFGYTLYRESRYSGIHIIRYMDGGYKDKELHRYRGNET